MNDERFAVFERRARRYPLPIDRTPEEAIKAALKSWRNPERFTLSTRGEDATSGRLLPLATCFALDVADRVKRLPEPSRTIVKLYFMVNRPTLPRDHDEAACRSQCQAHYGNDQIAASLGISRHSVAQYKQHAIAGIAAFFWPAAFRHMKRRKMGV